MTKRIEIYDTTLRDGMQGKSVNFSVDDKCRIVEQLDELGVDFIEGGWVYRRILSKQAGVRWSIPLNTS